MATVDGNYSGTTDQILRWASCKWGIDENTMRAEAWQETNWHEYESADLRTVQAQCAAGNWNGWNSTYGYCAQSYGILQTKVFDFNIFPATWDSTAFNADFRGAYWRACMNGDAGYLNGGGGGGAPAYPGGTASQLEQGCLGEWESGSWYDSSAIAYMNANAALVAQIPSAPWQLTTINTAGINITAPAQNAVVSGTVTIPVTLPNEATDPNDCYACLSIDAEQQTCSPGLGPFTWNTLAQAVQYPISGKPAPNGHHAISVDTYSCPSGPNLGPFYHVGIDVTVNN
jgi:hypothetical protein